MKDLQIVHLMCHWIPSSRKLCVKVDLRIRVPDQSLICALLVFCNLILSLNRVALYNMQLWLFEQNRSLYLPGIVCRVFIIIH